MNPVEWSKAQDLLVKLVQALAPLTVNEVPATFFLNKRFFMPHQWSEEAPSLSKHPIRLLTSLQKEMNKFVGETPKKEEPGIKREVPPVAKQAKQLIAEVQEAIGQLANSEFIQSPKEAPLKEALKKLKPNLDQIIEAVSKEQESETEEEPSFRHPLPRSSREEGIKKALIPLAKAPNRSPDVKQAVREVKKESSPLPSEPLERKPEKSKGEERGAVKKGMESDSEDRAVFAKEGIKPPLPLASPPKIVPPQTGLFALPEEIESKPLFVEEVSSLPGTLIVPHPKNLDPLRKKKKKKKAWFRKDREKDNES